MIIREIMKTYASFLLWWLSLNTFRCLILNGALVTTMMASSVANQTDASPEFVLLGVSGGLQDGFPERFRLDFHPGQKDESRAILLGPALVRGYKSYLDVMQPGWRQYTVR
jgi:hypothetical protein